MHLRRITAFLFVIGVSLPVFPIQSCFGQAAKEVTNSIGMKLVFIPKGTFTMGSSTSEEGSLNDERQHQVKINQDYYLGIHEVTQSQYAKVLGKNPSFFQGDEVATRVPAKTDPRTGRVIEEEKKVAKDTSNHPAENLDWSDAKYFCQRLSDLPEEREAGRVYRLPTEAEWEYACRAGTETAFSFGGSSDSLKEYGWYSENSGRKFEATYLDRRTHPVGEKKPNPWGLYDMHGNVWEWCSDWYGEYPKDEQVDPKGPEKGSQHVIRGGSWRTDTAYCRSAARYGIAQSPSTVGFRVVLDIPEGSK